MGEAERFQLYTPRLLARFEQVAADILAGLSPREAVGVILDLESLLASRFDDPTLHGADGAAWGGAAA